MGNPREPAQPGLADSRRSEAGRDALSPPPADRSTTRLRRRRKGIRSGRAPARPAHPGNADTSPRGARHRAHLAAYCVWKRTYYAAARAVFGLPAHSEMMPATRIYAGVRWVTAVVAPGREREI